MNTQAPKQQKSDQAIAHKLREALASANDYANRLRDRGYTVLLEGGKDDNGNTAVCVNDIGKTLNLTL